MRLNRDIRCQISALLVAGHQQKVIAKLVGISEGGLSKEISRNGGRKKYDPDKADKRAVRLKHKAHIHYEYSDEVWAETEALIKEDLSPEQVVGRRGLEGKKSPSVPTIYRHIEGREEFKPHLRHGDKKYRERGTPQGQPAYRQR
ncbi:hypothetical protein [uncultured Fibrobacter sp.]|uniref:hypothetical protein n=1 Tax=uncultured Fibrobacter sp. TaxID=261512 RepID=UPI003450432A